MEQKNSKIFSRETMQSVSAFCKSEGIEDVDHFMYLCFKQGFDIRKYGLLGETLNEGEKDLITGGIGEKQVEIEVIKEIRVEVPVEVIKEVEKIVEVIKEVPVEVVVEKIIQTSDDTQINELLSKIEHLNGEISIKCFEIDNIRQEFSTKTTEIDNIRQEFSTKTTEMENIFQNEMSKKDEELDELRRKLDISVTNNGVNMLQETLQKLRGELQQKNLQINELQKINNDLQGMLSNKQGTYLRSSNLRDRL
jgi:DNA repair exonuclease SbcCD ATPase subunit